MNMSDFKLKSPWALALAVSIGVGTGYLATSAYSGKPKVFDRAISQTQADWLKLGGAVVGLGILLATKQKLTAPVVSEPIQPELPYSDLPLLDIAVNQQKHPHVMIIGKTGGGKSTLAEWLASKCPGKRFAIAPHLDRTQNQWKGCHGVFAGGRNFGTSDDEPVDYAALVAGKVESPSASQCMMALLTEMNRRYSSPLPQDSHPVHNWLIDEVPAIASAIDKAFGEQLKPILFEARKVGLRLFLLTQGDNVETLKIKGQGKLREQFSYVYVGENACVRLRQLKQRVPKLPSDRRFAVVDTEVALLPELNQMLTDIKATLVPDQFVGAFVEAVPELPKPSALVNREPTDTEVEALAIGVCELLSEKPELTANQLAKALHFTGRYNKRGTELVKSVLELL
jgi:energy-coupling factor transporter ATP-binding protein EcfA2